MFELREITPRVQRLRERYRDAVPVLDAERVRLLTDYYKVSEKEQPVLRRANALRQILTNMTIRVEPDELIVGNVSRHFRGCNLWPEWGGIGWLIQELDSGAYDKKTAADGYMTLDEADREYLHSVESFWQEHSISATVDAAMPPELSALAGAGVLTSGPVGNGAVPSGHFNANYRKVVEKGFGAIRQEALEKLEKLNGRIMGDDAEKWFFYRAVVTCSDAVILFAKRYAAECRRLAAECLGEDRQAQSSVDERRREELLKMADSLDWIMENPARTFHEALQACFPLPPRPQRRGQLPGADHRARRPARGGLSPRRPGGRPDHPGRGSRAHGLLLPQDGGSLPLGAGVPPAGRRGLLQQHAHHHRGSQARRQRRHKRGHLPLPAVHGPPATPRPQPLALPAQGLAGRAVGGRHRDVQEGGRYPDPRQRRQDRRDPAQAGALDGGRAQFLRVRLCRVFRVWLRVRQRERPVLEGLRERQQHLASGHQQRRQPAERPARRPADRLALRHGDLRPGEGGLQGPTRVLPRLAVHHLCHLRARGHRARCRSRSPQPPWTGAWRAGAT